MEFRTPISEVWVHTHSPHTRKLRGVAPPPPLHPVFGRTPIDVCESPLAPSSATLRAAPPPGIRKIQPHLREAGPGGGIRSVDVGMVPQGKAPESGGAGVTAASPKPNPPKKTTTTLWDGCSAHLTSFGERGGGCSVIERLSFNNMEKIILLRRGKWCSCIRWIFLGPDRLFDALRKGKMDT